MRKIGSIATALWALSFAGCGDAIDSGVNALTTGTASSSVASTPVPTGTQPVATPQPSASSAAPGNSTSTLPTGETPPMGSMANPVPTADASTTSAPTLSAVSSAPAPSSSVVSPDPTSMASEVPPVPSMQMPVPPVVRPSFVASGPGSYWQVGAATEGTGNADVTVTDSQPQQEWLGMGGAFNERGWDALMKLEAADREQAIQLLFGPEGARFNSARIPIGASDYGMDRYTLAPMAGDYEMTSFSLDRDRELLIPYVKAALAANPGIHLSASPWTPPPWMKSNNAFDRGTIKTDAMTLQAHALYLSRFIEEYAKEGINIEIMYPQNEPGYEQDYPSCGWSADTFNNYIKTYLGPMFQERGITAQIFCGTMSNETADTAVANKVAGDAATMAFVKGFGLQWGTQGAVTSLKSKGLVFQSEHKAGNYPWESSTFKSDKAPNDDAYARESWGLIRDWVKLGVNNYAAWNMVLDTVGKSLDTVRPWPQNALLTVDVNAKKLIITPTYYVFRHVSFFVDEHAMRVNASGDSLAFKNPDGSLVAVVYNSGAAKMMNVAMGGKTLQGNVPGQGWGTFYLAP